ncbi:MAG: (2,3-dihydroxybenzoyl)adenylate synthase, partial [Rhodospirillaceae bacterium]
MLDGVVRFPPEYAKKYREKGYWEDRSIASHFADIFAKWGDHIAIIDGETQVSYRELDSRSTRLALNLWDLGIRPLDRLVVLLPNSVEFAYLYFALQKIGAIPIMALPSHRYRELSQFVEIAQAKACVIGDKARDVDFRDLVDRVRREQPCLQIGIVRGEGRDGFHTFDDLLARTPQTPESVLAQIEMDPEDPAVFQLSGGTTGIPKLIPRSHNDYICNTKLASAVTGVATGKVLLEILPIAHNLPLACPGMQGFLMHGGTVVMARSPRPEVVFPLVQRHKVTHIHLVPAILIRFINDPDIGKYDLSSLEYLQSGGQRLQPEVRRRTNELIPQVFVQENFGMAEGLLMFVRADDPNDVRMVTVGTPVCADDEVRIVDDDDNVVPVGEVGEMCCRGPYTLRGYYGAAEHNARAFTSDGFYRSGDLMRQHPSGRYMVEGRKKDLINRGGEKISAEEIENLILMHPSVQNIACVAMPDPVLGERMCACVIPKAGRSLTFDDLIAHLEAEELARFKLPERLELMDDFPLSPFGKVSKKT